MKTIVFIHIPKAGGKSFEGLLKKNFSDDNKVIRLYRTGGQDLEGVFAKVPRHKIEQAELVYGHIPHRIENYIGRPCEYVSMLRNPVERVLSFYRYVKYDFTAHPLHEDLTSGKIGLVDLLSETYYETNKMTKMLAGFDVREQPKAFMLNDAKQNLKNMKAFGLLEKYDESCLLIAKQFHWTHPFYAKINISSEASKCEVINANTIQMIACANDMDIQLYEYAKTLFQQFIEKEGSSFYQALQSYSLLQQNEEFDTTLTDAAFDNCPEFLKNHLSCVFAYLGKDA